MIIGLFAARIAARGLPGGADAGPDKAGDHRAALVVQPEDGLELGGGDPPVPDEGQQFHLLPLQPELGFVVVLQEEAGRHAERPSQRLDDT